MYVQIVFGPHMRKEDKLENKWEQCISVNEPDHLKVLKPDSEGVAPGMQFN